VLFLLSGGGAVTVERLAAGNVANVELDVVDLPVFTTNTHGGLLG
jgi:hypothetical protein